MLAFLEITTSIGDGDSDGDNSLCRALSDVSVVDSCEVPRESSGIPLLRNTHCQICNKPYPMIGVLKPDDAEHRCRLCMLSVCQQCSGHRYHTTEDDGKGVQRRMCDRCYQKMIPAEADEDIELQVRFLRKDLSDYQLISNFLILKCVLNVCNIPIFSLNMSCCSGEALQTGLAVCRKH
ncbi:unnamed protein product [Strongylus vulgaris]|uniref:FYVE-type domain-containing protein n=1 Tax=Strongylus vulgaris TaxID=40348 RepID=A0A3P7J890_STRVU|nr:unnamed protein product [Strongylus vulgaris]